MNDNDIRFSINKLSLQKLMTKCLSLTFQKLSQELENYTTNVAMIYI